MGLGGCYTGDKWHNQDLRPSFEDSSALCTNQFCSCSAFQGLTISTINPQVQVGTLNEEWFMKNKVGHDVSNQVWRKPQPSSIAVSVD